jgi:hypothetical protein
VDPAVETLDHAIRDRMLDEAQYPGEMTVNVVY